MKSKTWFIYVIECGIPDVGSYVGRTTRPFEREREHKNKSSGAKLKAAIDLYGAEHFTFRVIAQCEGKKKAQELETYYIGLFGTAWPMGLNVQVPGGDGYMAGNYDRAKRTAAGIKRWSDTKRRERQSRMLTAVMNEPDERARASEAARKRWRDPGYREQQQLSATGKTHTEMTRRQMSNAASERQRRLRLARYPFGGGREYRNAVAEDRRRFPDDPAVPKKPRSDKGKQTDAQRIRRSEAAAAANRRNWADPVVREKRIVGMKAAVYPRLSAETRKKMSEAHQRRRAAIKNLPSSKPEGSA